MNIEINLLGQESTFNRKVSLVIGIIGVLYLLASIIFKEVTFRISNFLGIIFLPSFIESILYGLGRKGILKDNFPFLRINDEQLSFNKGGFISKATIILWDNVESIDVKLFELVIKSKDGKSNHIDLNSLTDENLRMVKDFISSIKQAKGI